MSAALTVASPALNNSEMYYLSHSMFYYKVNAFFKKKCQSLIFSLDLWMIKNLIAFILNGLPNHWCMLGILSCPFLRGRCKYSLNVLYYTSFSGNVTILFFNFSKIISVFHNFEGKNTLSACNSLKQNKFMSFQTASYLIASIW